MSFVAPTTNVIAITSGAQTIASGDVTITINLANSANLASNNYTMDVTDLGSIELDFNYIEDISDINEFTINVPRFDFEIREYVKDSNQSEVSFVQMITALSANDLIVVKVDFNAGSDYYYTTRDQCEFNYIDRKVKLSLQHPLKYDQTAFGKTWGTQLNSKIVVIKEGVDTEGGSGLVDTNAFFTRDLIEQYVSIIADTSNVTYYSDLYQKKSTSTVLDLDVDALFLQANTTADTNFTVATSTVKQVALSDCAIIGNVLGYGFYMPRYSKSNGATLTSGDFSELEMDFSYKNIRNFEIRIQYGDVEFESASVYDFQVINAIGTADVNVDYSSNINGMALCEAGPLDSTNVFEFGDFVSPSLPTGYEDNVVSSFKQIFRISDSNVDAGVAISGTILGIDKLKPYEYFSVGSGVHPLVNNKDFRPSYLKYNLLDDTIEFEAYEF